MKNHVNTDSKVKKISTNLRIYIIALIIAASVLGPYFYLIINSIRLYPESTSIIENRAEEWEWNWRPKNFSLEGYQRLFQDKKVLNNLKNSLIISFGTTFISVLISLFVAYALTRLKFFYKKQLELTLYTTQMFPGFAFIVPYFILFILIKKYLHIPMQNTHHGLIITYTSFALPFSILMMKNYMHSIPRELDEQAQIDGCNRRQIIFRILFPLALPGIVSVSIYSFIMAWNEILFAYTLTSDETQTVAIGLLQRVRWNWPDWFAMSLFVTVPIVIVFAFLQKKLVSGLGKGVVKG